MSGSHFRFRSFLSDILVGREPISKPTAFIFPLAQAWR